MGRQVSAEDGRNASQEIHWSPPDESGNEEEVIGDDEGKVGGEEEGCLAWLYRYLH
jgi:hypothetical protein